MAVTAAGVLAAGKIFNEYAGGASKIASLFGGSGSARRAMEAQWYANTDLMNRANAYNTWVMKNRYQLQTEDMKKAGINPLYGLGSAPSPTSAAGSVGMPDMVSEKNGRAQRAVELLGLAQDWSAKQAQIKNVEQQTKTEEQNTLLKTYEALTKEQETIEKKIRNKYLEEKEKQELENLKKDIEEKKSRISYNLAMAGTAESSIELNRAQAGSARAAKAKLEAETAGIEAKNAVENPKNEAYGSFLKDHRGIAGTIKGAQDLLGVLATLGGTGVAIYTKGKAGTARKATRRRKE